MIPAAKAIYRRLVEQHPAIGWVRAEAAYRAGYWRTSISPKAVAEALGRCRAALVTDAAGKPLWSKNATAVLPIGSLTKMMLALLVFDAIKAGLLNTSDEIVARIDGRSVPGQTIGLVEGEAYSVETLIRLSLIYSANDASELLTETVYGSVSSAIEAMNHRAQEIGLGQTIFYNPHGLEPMPGHYWTGDNTSTAADMAALALCLIKSHPQILAITSSREMEFRHSLGAARLNNTNHKLLSRCAGVDGLKTGFTTTADFCLAATCERRDGRQIIILLGAKTDEDRCRLVHLLCNGAYRALPA
jgi:D-alanyl-D-alanine carboxypeptidase